MAEGKRCHGGETEMVPRQHSDDPTTRRDVGAKESVDVSESCKMVGDPGYRVPTSQWHRKRGTNVQ